MVGRCFTRDILPAKWRIEGSGGKEAVGPDRSRLLLEEN